MLHISNMTFCKLSISSTEQMSRLLLMMTLMKKGLLLGETDLCNGDHRVLQIHAERP